jgi:hypothetical protein
MSDAGLIGVEARLEQLAGAGETIHGYAPTSETDEGIYFLVIRSWPHPDVEGAATVSLRYAYLTRGEGSDGWLENGINMRVEDGNVERFLTGLARLVYYAVENAGTGPATKDLRPLEE